MAIVFDLNTEIRTIAFRPDTPVDLPLDSLMVVTAVRKPEPEPSIHQEVVTSTSNPSLALSENEINAITWEDAEWQ